MIQTIYDIIKAHGGVPIAIGIKVETKKAEDTGFIIQLPVPVIWITGLSVKKIKVKMKWEKALDFW